MDTNNSLKERLGDKEKNKLIHFRQIIFLFFLLVMVVVFSGTFFEQNIQVYKLLVSFYIVVTGMMLIPCIKVELNYSNVLHTFVFYFPMYIWGIVILTKEIFCRVDVRTIEISIICCLLLLIGRFSDIKKIICIKYVHSNISNKKFVSEVLDRIIAIISEEFYYSAYVVTVLNYEIYSVAVSGFLFVIAHYLNRWAKKMFSIKDYIFIFILGIMKSLLFVRTHNILIPIMIHLMYNSTDFYTLIKRKMTSNNVLFDDY